MDRSPADAEIDASDPARQKRIVAATSVAVPYPIDRELGAKATLLLAGRRRRDQTFGGTDLFGEPAWDILLDLFAAAQAGRRTGVSDAAVASAVAPTTALRWIDKLITCGLLQRQPDIHDRRRVYLKLTDRAEAFMRHALTVS